MILGAGSGDYAEWPAWLPFAVDLLVANDDDGPLTAALGALEGPVAPTTSPYVTGQARRLAAHIAARAGDRDAAASHWRAAREIMSEAGVVFDAAVMALELAEVELDRGRFAGGGGCHVRAVARGTVARARPPAGSGTVTRRGQEAWRLAATIAASASASSASLRYSASASGESI